MRCSTTWPRKKTSGRPRSRKSGSVSYASWSASGPSRWPCSSTTRTRLHPKTLVGLKRLIEVVRDGGGTLSIVLAGHPKLKNDLRRPTMEEIGSRVAQASSSPRSPSPYSPRHRRPRTRADPPRLQRRSARRGAQRYPEGDPRHASRPTRRRPRPRPPPGDARRRRHRMTSGCCPPSCCPKILARCPANRTGARSRCPSILARIGAVFTFYPTCRKPLLLPGQDPGRFSGDLKPSPVVR